jgi:hypothetical protein
MAAMEATYVPTKKQSAMPKIIWTTVLGAMLT